MADIALFMARRRKADDPTAMIMLENIKVNHTGNRINAILSVPRDKAKETLDRSVQKK
jgi:hypothetical protein